MNNIRTITLDLDDTLWAIQPVIKRAERRLYAWLKERYPRITAKFSPAAIVELRNGIAAEHPNRGHDFAFLRREVLRKLANAGDYGEGLVDDAMAVFNEVRNDVRVYPEVRPTLTVLRRSYRLLAVTNGNANLETIGISELFDDVISASVAGAAKPAREIFDVAVKAGGATADQTLHVGDHPQHDVQGALDAGLKAVWINRHGSAWPKDLQQPDRVIRDVGQLISILGPANR
jgi:putative hydrolase of the HAD superfamily